jgi:uncharacterized protein (TIGR00730 family)
VTDARRRVASVCVYCGSSFGNDARFTETARALGAAIAGAGMGLVYGGGSVGLMGVVADAALGAGGEVVGVIPRGLFSVEHAHRGLNELVEVESMHARKLLMSELADGFVALPGGLGTLEELAEITTWAQLGIHCKPIVLVDVDGFWSPLLDLLDRMVDAGFLKPRNRALLAGPVAVDAVVDAIASYRADPVTPLLDASET